MGLMIMQVEMSCHYTGQMTLVTKLASAILLCGIFAIALGASSTSVDSSWEKPWFCHRLDCPPFNVTYSNKTAGIEIRKYAPGLWVSTNWTGVRIEDADNVGFDRLFNYMGGENEAGMKIEMTSPVRTEVIPGQGPFCESTFVVSFYVPYDFQPPHAPPPKPTSDLVYMRFLPELQFAVYGYPGFAFEWEQILPNFIYLDNFLVEQGIRTVPNRQVVAGYDPPFRLRNRWNEVNAIII